MKYSLFYSKMIGTPIELVIYADFEKNKGSKMIRNWHLNL